MVSDLLQIYVELRTVPELLVIDCFLADHEGDASPAWDQAIKGEFITFLKW